jgi:hypothetical protein
MNSSATMTGTNANTSAGTAPMLASTGAKGTVLANTGANVDLLAAALLLLAAGMVIMLVLSRRKKV